MGDAERSPAGRLGSPVEAAGSLDLLIRLPARHGPFLRRTRWHRRVQDVVDQIARQLSGAGIQLEAGQAFPFPLRVVSGLLHGADQRAGAAGTPTPPVTTSTAQAARELATMTTSAEGRRRRVAVGVLFSSARGTKDPAAILMLQLGADAQAPQKRAR